MDLVPKQSTDSSKKTDECECSQAYQNECDKIKELGRGCFGIVYHMKEKKTSYEFAMKMISSNKKEEADQFNEAWNSKRRHDNVVYLTSCVFLPHGSTDEGHILICMELCSQKTLKMWLEEHPTQRSLDYVKPFMGQMLSALCCLHGQGIIHRDLKPGNIMFATDAEYSKKGGMLKIGDFGMITRCIDEAEGRQNKKYLERGSFVTRVHKRTYGAPLYEAPEKNSGNRYNNKVDVFSYGLICAELLCEFKNSGVRRAVFKILRDGDNPKLLANQPPEVIDFIKSATKSDPSERLFAPVLRKHPFFDGIKQRPKLPLFAQTIYSEKYDVYKVVKINVEKFFEKEKDKLSFAKCKNVEDIINVQSKLFDYMFPNSTEQNQNQCTGMTNEETLGSYEMGLIPPFEIPGMQCCRLGITIPFLLKLLPRETVQREDTSAMVQRIKNLQLAMTGSSDEEAEYENYSQDQISEYVDYLYEFADRMRNWDVTFFGLETESVNWLGKRSSVKLIPGIDIWHEHPFPVFFYVEDLFGSIGCQSLHQYKNEIGSKTFYKSTKQKELDIRKRLIPISPMGNFFNRKTMKETLSEIIKLKLPLEPEMVLMRIKTIARVLNSGEVNVKYHPGYDDLLNCYLFLLIKACNFILEMSEEEVYFNISFSNSFVHVALSPVIDTSLVLPTFEVFFCRYWTDWSNIGWKMFAHIAREHEAFKEIEREMHKNVEIIKTFNRVFGV